MATMLHSKLGNGVIGVTMEHSAKDRSPGRRRQKRSPPDDFHAA
jgi:hypothetical protein